MEFSLDSSYSDLGRRMSQSSYRNARRFSTQSNQSMFSVSSYASDLSSTLSSSYPSTNFYTKPPKYRLEKLIKSSLKHTLKSNKSDSNNAHNTEYWDLFHRKLRKIISFTEQSSLTHLLNEPFNGKQSNKHCSSMVHLLCKQFYLYARSHNWSICFKILDCITQFCAAGANTSIFYHKIDETAHKNYNSIHTLYEGLQMMLRLEVINSLQFISHFSYAISAGNEGDFNPSVLTLCCYEESDTQQWQNITYWMGDCLFSECYVHIISPYLAKVFVLMGYDILHVCGKKLDRLDYNHSSADMDLLSDAKGIKRVLETNDKKCEKIHGKVVSFLWFIRFGNFKRTLITIVDIGIRQLALNEFAVSTGVIEEILSYSHSLVISHSEMSCNIGCNLYKLNLDYFDENEWMLTAFGAMFKLDKKWIEWIGEFVLPQMTQMQSLSVRKYLSEHITDKQWNKFVKRMSLAAMVSFAKSHILPAFDTPKMQYLIMKYYKNKSDLLCQLLNSAEYNVSKVFGSNNILFKICKDDSVENVQFIALLNVIHSRMQNSNDGMAVINDLIFGENEWMCEREHICDNIKLIFAPYNKYTHFCKALNDLLHKLTTVQHYFKFIFFMENDLIHFQYCLNKGLVNVALQNLMNATAFEKKALCIQLLCKWIYKHFALQTDIVCRQKIAEISITAINAYMTNIISAPHDIHERPEPNQLIMEQYLCELKAALSGNDENSHKNNALLNGATNNNNGFYATKRRNSIEDNVFSAQKIENSHIKNGYNNSNNNIIPLGFYYFKAESEYRKQNGSIIFGKLLKSKHFKQNQLRHQMNWDMLIDTIYLNISNGNEYIIVFKALKLIAENLFRKHEKYRILYTKNKTVQERILSRIGGNEFLLGLGFEKVTVHKLVCNHCDFEVIATAISAINAKLAKLINFDGTNTNTNEKKTKLIIMNGTNSKQRKLRNDIHKKNNKKRKFLKRKPLLMSATKEIELRNNKVRTNENAHWTRMIKIVK